MHMAGPEAAELAQALRRLRAAAGNPTLEKISHSIKNSPSTASLSRLFNGRTLPAEPVVAAIAVALLDMKPDSSAHKGGRLGHVMDLYRKAKSAQNLRPGRTRPHGQDKPAHNGHVDPAPLQQALRKLIRHSGMSLERLAHAADVPKSTLHDALRHPTRPPSRRIVQKIAVACRVPPDPYLRMLDHLENERDLLARRTEPERLAAAEPAKPPPAAAPASAPQPQPALDAPLVETLVTAAATRPPAEIAALVAAMQAGGHTAVAARMVHQAAATRSVDDVTALALALLATPTAGPPAEPRQQQPPVGSS